METEAGAADEGARLTTEPSAPPRPRLPEPSGSSEHLGASVPSGPSGPSGPESGGGPSDAPEQRRGLAALSPVIS